MSNIRSSWLKRFNAKAKFDKVAPEQETYVEIVSAVPVINDNGKDSVKVNGTADGAQYGYSGYVNKKYSNGVYDVLEQAQKEKRYVIMRFEKMRKADSDPSLTIEEVTKDMTTGRNNVFNVLTAIYNVNTGEWIHTGNKVSDVSEDPALVQDWLDRYVLNGSETVDADEFFAEKETKKAPFVPKGPEYEKSQQLLTMFFFVRGEADKYEIRLPESTNKRLAKATLALADKVQLRLTGIEAPNYGDYSHTRARFLLFHVIENILPMKSVIDGSKDLKDWGSAVLKEAYSLIEWSQEG